MVKEKSYVEKEADAKFQQKQLGDERKNNAKIRKIHSFLEEIYLRCLESNVNVAPTSIASKVGVPHQIKDVLIQMKVLKHEPPINGGNRGHKYYWIYEGDLDVKLSEKVNMGLLDILRIKFGELKKPNNTSIQTPSRNLVSVSEIVKRRGDGNKYKLLLNSLPNRFSTQMALEIFKSQFKIVDHNSKNYLKVFVEKNDIKREKRGWYSKKGIESKLTLEPLPIIHQEIDNKVATQKFQSDSSEKGVRIQIAKLHASIGEYKQAYETLLGVL